MKYSSKVLEQAVEALNTLPSIGKKSALRLALHLLKDKHQKIEQLNAALTALKNDIKICQVCHNYSDIEICEICDSNERNKKLLCVVESVRDVMAIEDTNHFRGLYHVLGGVISPLDGIGHDQLNIDSLIQRVERDGIEEIIMALSPTLDGDTTMFYLSKKLESFEVQISTIARGVSFGGDLEYADEITLGRSIQSRLPYTAQSGI